MSDEKDSELERKSADGMEVRQYAGDQPGTRDGITRQSGIVATGRTNERSSSQATFRGNELLRRNKRR